MTEQEQNIAIAEACPSVITRTTGSAGWNYRNSITGRIHPCIDGSICRDQNAMHEAEKVLDYHQQCYYSQVALPKIARGKLVCGQVFATAAQKAEAFLRTLNKWHDSSEGRPV